jgi:hypothetical protein
VSGDTTAVGAEARAVESGVDCGLGRVKGWAPPYEIAGSKCGQSFYDEHGSRTFWAAETSGLGGGGSDGGGGVGRRTVGEQALTEG